jgi:glycerophosphoryl diester phosphodiesterase
MPASTGMAAAEEDQRRPPPGHLPVARGSDDDAVTVLISAHSGGREAARPGSYEAYEHALSSGAEYAELDIRRTGDNVLVVYHDAHAGRGGPPVSALSWAQLCERAGYRVPPVAEVMALLGGKLRGHLDLKEIGYEKDVIELALTHFGPGQFVATTLEDVSVSVIKEAYPEVPAALSLGRDLAGRPLRQRAEVRASELFPLPRIRACGADWVSVHYRLARAGVAAACRRNGIGLMVWTVDGDRLIDRLLTSRAVDVLITNRPAYAAARRSQLAAGPGPRRG